MKKIVVSAIALPFIAMSVSAQAYERSEAAEKYLGDIGREATKNSYNQVSLTMVEEDASYYNQSGHKAQGYGLRASAMLGRYYYGVGQAFLTDDDGVDSQRISVGVGIAADLGLSSATDFFSELLVTHYDVSMKSEGLSNDNDGIFVDWRAGFRSNWGVPGIDFKIYGGMTDNRAYSGSSDGGTAGVLGASIGYSVIPELTVSLAAERVDGPSYSAAKDSGMTLEETAISSLTLSYNF